MSINITEFEEINLEGWSMIKDTPTEKVYHKDNLEKQIEIFENYSLEKNFKDEKIHGPTIGRMKEPFFHYTNTKSKVYLIENYKEGKQEGVTLSFYEDGAKISEAWKNDKPHGKREVWFGNGQKNKEENYMDGVLHGKNYEWYESGQLKLEENYANGVQEGESLKYLENGKLKRKKFYKKGRIEGLVYELWDYKGNLIDGGVYNETEYKNNVPHGKEVVYFPNNTKMREGNYKNGALEGERIWWNKNGTISIKEYYKDGKLEGERFLFDEYGELESTQLYKNDEPVS